MEKNENEKQCSICSKTNTSMAILSCSHCFCSACLYKQIFCNYPTYQETSFTEEMELSCVICDKGSHKMSKKSIFEFLKAPITNSDSPVLCKNEHGLKVMSFCNKCNWEMCEKCYKQHSSISLFADHQITTDVGIAKVKNTCFKHKDKKLKFQCLECSVPICGICREVEHFQHKVSFIDDYYNSKQKEIKSIKMPYDSYEAFKQKLKNEEELVISELNNKSIKIFDRIENLINQLIEMKKDFEIKVNNIEDDLTKTTYVHDKIFEKLYYDINNIRSSDFNNLNLLKKIPDNYKSLQYNKDYFENFEKHLQNLEDSTKNIQGEVVNVKSIDFNNDYEAISIQTNNVGDYVLKSMVLMSNGNIACSNDSNEILIFDGASDCKLIYTINAAKPNLNNNHYGNAFGQTNNYPPSLNCLLSMPEGILIAACDDNSLRLWSSKNNYQIPTSLKCNQSVQHLFTNHKNTFIFGTSNQYIEVWGNIDQTKIMKYDTLQLLSSLYNYECISDRNESGYFGDLNTISIKNDHLASASSNEIKIFNFSNENNIQHIYDLKGHLNKVNSLIYLEEGKFASSSEDLNIKIWSENNNSYICLKSIVACTKNFELLPYKNKKFATISTDGTLKIWNHSLKLLYSVFTNEKEFSIENSTIVSEDNHLLTLLGKNRLKIYKI